MVLIVKNKIIIEIRLKMFKCYLYFLNYTFFPFIFYWVYTATIVALKVSAYKTTTKPYIYELKPKHDSHDKHAVTN